MNNHIEVTGIKTVLSDAVLVREMKKQDKIGNLYIPEISKGRTNSDRGKAWLAEVIALGEGIDSYTKKNVAVGDTVAVAPVAIECPSFSSRNKEDEIEKYIFVRDEDLIGWVEK